MTNRRSTLQEDTHFRVLSLLQENPQMSQRELAKAVGISAGGTHYVLNALMQKGLIKLSNFSASNEKRRYAYVLTPSGIAKRAALTKQFLLRKIEEYDALRAEIELLQQEIGLAGVGADSAAKSATLQKRDGLDSAALDVPLRGRT